MQNLFPTDELEYVGFWKRLVATLIDTVLIFAITWPLLTAFYGDAYWNNEALLQTQGPMDILLNWFLPIVATIVFWVIKQATPGKMLISAKIIDAETGSAPTVGQCIGRYLAYFISILPLGLGLLWIAFDKRKQGWHDKLAGTVVVYQKKS